MTTSPANCSERESAVTYEGIVDGIVEHLHARHVLPTARPAPWDAFMRLSDLVHHRFEMPSTTVTPIMRRLLFAVGLAVRPRYVVGVGTFVGYAFAWLIRDRSDAAAGPFCDRALGIDVDQHANELARRNCAHLGHGTRLRFRDGDGTLPASWQDGPVHLLYLDLDDPQSGKTGYVTALQTARDRLAPGAVILAHDPCVAAFAGAFADYHAIVHAATWLRGPWILPVDECGLSVAIAP